MTKSAITIVDSIFCRSNSFAQGVSGGATMFAPNLGVEIDLGEPTTHDLSAGCNWCSVKYSLNSNKKSAHFIVQSKLRYSLCQRFNVHFFGVHALYSGYNIHNHSHMNYDKYSCTECGSKKTILDQLERQYL